MLTVNGQPAEPGCYVEGSWGQYGADHLADQLESFAIAIPKGIDPRRHRRIAEWILERTGFAHSGTAVNNLADTAWEHHAEAHDALTDLASEATKGGYWEWEDGECFLRSYVCPECGRDATDPKWRQDETGHHLSPMGALAPCEYCADAEDPGCMA